MKKGMAAVDAVLVLIRQDGRTQDVPLKHDRQIVGRHTDCQIRVPIAAVSRHHCEIAVYDSSVTVKDLGSSNGTHVNGRRIDEETPLSAGDVLLIGTLLFVVRLNGQPAKVDAQAAEAKGRAQSDVIAGPKSGTVTPSSAPSSPLDELDLDSESSSVGDFDFEDFLKDDDEEQPRR